MSVASFLYAVNGARPWRRRVRVWDCELRATSLDRLVCLLLHRAGLMGAGERRLLGRLVRPGMEVVDIGANLGLYSLQLSRLVGPAGRVHAFEPEPRLYRALCANLRHNGATNVWAVNCALGGERGRVAFYRSALNGGDNRMGGLAWKGQRLEVEQDRLDSLLSARPVDFVKMDVQGYELQVLRGMEGLLAASPRLSLYFELWPAGLRAAGTDPADVLDFLRRRDFRLYRTAGGEASPVADPAGLERELPNGKYANFLAKREA
jgi:FkbM family methyltransferase